MFRVPSPPRFCAANLPSVLRGSAKSDPPLANVDGPVTLTERNLASVRRAPEPIAAAARQNNQIKKKALDNLNQIRIGGRAGRLKEEQMA